MARSIGWPQSSFNRALNPEENPAAKQKTLDKRINEVHAAYSGYQSGKLATPARRPSITEMLDDPEVKASDPTRGLARAGGSIVARGYDEDGLMYAVEIVFHVRPDARETRHDIGLANSSSGPA